MLARLKKTIVSDKVDIALHSQFRVLDEDELASDELGPEPEHVGALGTPVTPQTVPDHLGEPDLKIQVQDHL